MKINNDNLHFESITQLVNHYENEALSIDLEEKAPQLYNVLQRQKIKATDVESEDELKEVRDFCTKAVASLKHKLSNVIINENYKGKANFIQGYVFDIRLYLEYKELVKNLTDKKENLKVGAEREKPKIKTFKEFFNKEVPDELIQKIKTEFKDYKGKKMAFLIYLLHKVHKLINYSSNSNTEARKHFVIGLTGKANIVAGVDKIFNLNDVTLKDPKFENDNDYSTMQEKLLETIKKIVV